MVVGNEDGAAASSASTSARSRSRGTPVDRAGLTNGALHVLDVADQAVATDAQYRAAYGKGSRSRPGQPGRLDPDGAEQNAEAAPRAHP